MRYQQLTLAGDLGVEPGQTYRNVHSGKIGTVVFTTQRRQAWVVLRVDGRETEITLRWLSEHWRPCNATGGYL